MSRLQRIRAMRLAVAAALLFGLCLGARPAAARTLLKNICRVKGQEENTLHGLGLVMGLKGTGDGGDFLPTIRGLTTALQLMGNNPFDKQNGLGIKDAKNVALVMVTVTVPAAGARQGDTLDCVVSSIGSAKTLSGGTLFMTPLQGPQVPQAVKAKANSAAQPRGADSRVYAFAQGQVHVDGVPPTVGKVHNGCRLEEDFFNVFAKEGKITLVLDKNIADFQVAQDVAELVNSQLNFQSHEGYLAKALNAVNIEVTIPQQYRDDPVLFISQVLSLPTLEPHAEARVVVNDRTGSVVIGGDVEIGSVVVTHKNIVLETGDNTAASRFVPLDVEKTSTAKLKSLVESLNAVKVPTEDIIDIIKGLERNGKLHGVLIVE
jgi:flagellar P-ring protein FlgI